MAAAREELFRTSSSLDALVDETLADLLRSEEAFDPLEKVAQDEGIMFDLPDLLTLETDYAVQQLDELMPIPPQVFIPVSEAASVDPFLYEEVTPLGGGGGGRQGQTRTTSRSSSDEGIDMSPNSSKTEDEDAASLFHLEKALLGGKGGLRDVDDDDDGYFRLEDTPAKPLHSFDPNDLKCYVCREQAGKHSYYGGKVCPSCRAFFRRAVQSKYYEIFFCNKGERCEINLKTRRSCQYCRFKKCLESGMRIAWVLPDGERNRRFNKLNKAAMLRNTITSSPTSSMLVPLRTKGPFFSVTNDDLAQIERTHANLQEFGSKRVEEYLVANPEFLKELAAVSYFGGKMSYDFFRSFSNMCDLANRELFLAQDEFRFLPPGDRRKLVEANGPIISRFKSATCLQEDNSCLTSRIETATKSGQFPALKEISDRLKAMNLTDKKPLLGYDQFFASPWAANVEDEDRHYELTLKMKAWPRDSDNSPVDEVQMSLMKMIIGFSGDFLDLERPDVVERVQLRYAYLLQKYLKYRYGDDAGNVRFASGLYMASFAREANDIHMRKSLRI